MKNTYIVIIVLIVLILGGVFVFGMGQKAEAPKAPETSGTLETPNVITGEVKDTEEPVACTMDAKMCPDGSYVGRIAPKCEFAACPTVEQPAVKEFRVVGKNFAFVPSTITVKKGDKVKIIFENSEGFHDFKIDEYGVATKKTKSPTTEVLEFTADKAGSFEYYCSVGEHRSMGMKGTLKVE